MYFEKKIGPEFGFGDEHEIRPPVIEKTRHETRHVEGNILMERAWRQTRRDDGSRRDGGCGEKDVEAAGGKLFEQRQKREAFSDTHAMQPCERSHWAQLARNADALLDAPFIFEALALTPKQKQRREGRECSAHEPVNLKETCALHHRPPDTHCEWI